MSDTALLIIDIQVGNFSDPELLALMGPIYNGDKLLAKIKSLIGKARLSKIPIIYIQNCGGNGDPDKPGTPGWNIHPSIVPIEEEIIVQKRTPDSFHNTNLKDELDYKGIKHLIIAGLQTEFCIDTTCRSAFSLGYNITLVKDAHSTWNSPVLTAQQIIDHHNNVLGAWFVTLREEKEIKF